MRAHQRIEKVERFVAGNSVFVRLTTDQGVQGVGESTAFAFPRAVDEVLKSFEPYLVGIDPMDVEKHWLSLYRALGWRGITLGGAISAIDQALWDIKARQWLGEDYAHDPLMESREEAAERHAARWIMIPLTRAIDTLVINIGSVPGPLRSVLRSVADRRPDFVEWIDLRAGA